MFLSRLLLAGVVDSRTDEGSPPPLGEIGWGRGGFRCRSFLLPTLSSREREPKSTALPPAGGPVRRCPGGGVPISRIERFGWYKSRLVLPAQAGIREERTSSGDARVRGHPEPMLSEPLHLRFSGAKSRRDGCLARLLRPGFHTASQGRVQVPWHFLGGKERFPSKDWGR